MPLLGMNVNAKSVISTESVDIFNAGSFDDASMWTLSSNDGYTDDPAQYTSPMIEDSMVSFTHSREQSFQTTTLWSISSSTNSNYSTGLPDGWITYSSGPDIKLSNFDTSSLDSYDLVSVSVVIAFEIPDTLADDTVEFSINWDGQFEQFKVFNTPQTPANHMSAPYYTHSLDGITDWDWDDFDSAEFNLNYQSIMPDDSQLNVDALGLMVTWQSPSYGFETSKALNTTMIHNSPLMAIDMSDGIIENISITPCGFEKTDISNEGVWISEEINLPPEQTWGRVHTTGNWTGDVYSKSENSVDWVVVTDAVLENYQAYQLKIVIDSGCLENVMVGINDPSLYIVGEVQGSTIGLDHDNSWLRISMNNELVYEHNLVSSGQFSVTIPVGELLPYDETGSVQFSSGEIDVGVGVRFQWDSDGSAETTVVAVSTLSLIGGYHIEWDYDPVCTEISDFTGETSLSEDSGGILIPFLDTCNDDYTSELIISATTEEDFLNVVQDSEYLKIYPKPNTFGSDIVTITVTDESGNEWEDSFVVVVLALEDSPIGTALPSEVWLQVDELREFEFTISDVDTSGGDLSISVSHSWVNIDISGMDTQEYNHSATLSINPIQSGTYSVEITISDGVSIPYSHTITVVAQQMPDLFVESVEESTADGTINVGDVVSISVTIGNSGGVSAELVTVRCFVNDAVTDTLDIPVIAPDKYETVVCVKQVDSTSLDSGMELVVVVDYTRTIQEISEDNNNYSKVIDVLKADNNLDVSVSVDDDFQLTQIHITLISVLIVGGLIGLLMIGPKKIRRA